MPAYVIFHDATLVERLERKPSSLKEMSDISGIGSAKLEKYGAEFLDVVMAYTEDEAI